jgi:hypothetical protein
MARNCPAVLQELKICAATDIDMEADAVPQSSVENDWEGGLLRNWQLYEGLRGAFTFMVLWDHFHPLSVFAADSWQADTSLFVILSGFTTGKSFKCMSPTCYISTQFSIDSGATSRPTSTERV